MAFELNSAVISSSLHPKPGVEFSTPIEIASTNIEQVEVGYVYRGGCKGRGGGHGGPMLLPLPFDLDPKLFVSKEMDF